MKFLSVQAHDLGSIWINPAHVISVRERGNHLWDILMIQGPDLHVTYVGDLVEALELIPTVSVPSSWNSAPIDAGSGELTVAASAKKARSK